MRFSLIVPIYNGEKYFVDCLDSIFSQEYSDFEVIVVDDGSTDQTGNIADSYASKYSNLSVIHQSNRGLLLSRRVGLSQARGDYVIFVDGDDLLLDDALKIINESTLLHDPDIVMYGFSRQLDYSPSIIKSNRLDAGHYSEDDYYTVKKYAIGGYMSSMWMKAVRTCVYDTECSYSNYAGLMHGEDLLQTLPVVDRARSLVMIDEVLYYYRPNEGGSTSCFKESQLRDIAAVNARLLEYGNKWGGETYSLAQIGEMVQYINLLTIIQQSNASLKEKCLQCSLLRSQMESLGLLSKSRIEKLRLDHRVELYALKASRYIVSLFIIWLVQTIKNVPGIR